MKFTKKHSILSVFFLCLLSSPLMAQIGTFRNINNGDGLIDWQINCFFKDTEGYIWLGGSYLVQRFDGHYIKTYNFPKSGKVNAINETQDGIMYVGTSSGLYTIARNNSLAMSAYPSQISKSVFSILTDEKNNIYVGTQDGLVIISHGKLKTFQPQNTDFPFNQVLSMQQAKDGVLWLLTPGGVVSYNPSTEASRTYPCLLATRHSFLTCMTLVDQTLYFGTNGSGVYKFDTLNGAIDPFMVVGDGSVTSLSSNGKSELYAGTAGTGIYFISISGKKVSLSFDSSPSSNAKLTSSMVTSSMVDNQGTLWVGSSEDLGFDFMFLYPKAFQLFKTASFSTNNLPIHQFYLGKGYKLLTNRYGIYYISEATGNVQYFETGIGKAKCLRPGDVLSFIPYNDKVILGGECGIYSFDPSSASLEVFKPLAFLNKATVYHLNTDAKGNLWVATSVGLSILEKTTQKVISYNSLNSHLPDDVVRYVYFDRRGRTWICTNKGICFWDEQKKDFKAGKFPKDFIDKQKIHFMMEDRKGNILFCYDIKKSFVTDPLLKNFRSVCTEKDADFTGLCINKVLQDTSGTFWFIGSRGAIKANEGLTTFKLYSTTEGLMEPFATNGCFDKNGKLWLSNNKGLYSSSSLSSYIQRSTAPMVITDIRINGASEMDEMYEAIKNGSVIKLSRYKNNVEFQFSLLTYDKPDLMVYECKLKGFDKGWRILRGKNSTNYKNLKPGQYTFLVRRNMDHTCFKEVHFEIKPLLSTFEIILIIIFLGVAGWGYNHYTKLRTLIKTRIEKEKTDAEPKYRFNKIDEKEANEIIEKLKECMKVKQLYLSEELKMADLAKEVGCSNQTLSQVFNIFMNDKYYDFINRYRVEEFKRIITTTDYSNFTLKALSQKSGFSSYSSFFRTFKEQTGITPNEFLQNFESSRKS